MEIIFLAVGLLASIPLGFVVLFQNPATLGMFVAVMTALALASLFLRKSLPHLVTRFWLGAAAAAFAAGLALAWGACSRGPADGLCVIGGAHAMPYACFALAAAGFTFWRTRAAKRA